MSQKLALGVEYNGKNYSGWQKQQTVLGVQEHLEQALSAIAGHEVEVYAAGRTDAGVHATNQVVHFTAKKFRPDNAWVIGTNTLLPESIKVKWIKEVPEDFHARFSALSRTYKYLIYNNRVPSTFTKGIVTWYPKKLNSDLMNGAAKNLLGEHDFSSFRATHCQSKSTFRNVENIVVSQKDDLIVVDITANAFLHHMVRNIVGTLLKVGTGEEKSIWVKELLELKDRTKAGITAPSDGLYLTNVSYHEKYNIPQEFMLPWFLKF